MFDKAYIKVKENKLLFIIKDLCLLTTYKIFLKTDEANVMKRDCK